MLAVTAALILLVGCAPANPPTSVPSPTQAVPDATSSGETVPNVVQLGETFRVGDWEVTVEALSEDITAEVLSNPNNSTPDTATGYIAADVRATYLQGNFALPGHALRFFYLGGDGVLFDDIDRHLAVSYIGERFTPDSVSAGKTTVGKPVLAVPSGDLSAGFITVSAFDTKGKFVDSEVVALENLKP